MSDKAYLRIEVNLFSNENPYSLVAVRSDGTTVTIENFRCYASVAHLAEDLEREFGISVHWPELPDWAAGLQKTWKALHV